MTRTPKTKKENNHHLALAWIADLAGWLDGLHDMGILGPRGSAYRRKATKILKEADKAGWYADE